MNTVFVGFIPLMMIALSPSRNSELLAVYDSEVGVSLVGLMVQERMMVVLVNVVVVRTVVMVAGGAGGQVDGHDTNASGHEGTKALCFTPTLICLDGDEFAPWFKAAKQHSSRKDCNGEHVLG